MKNFIKCLLILSVIATVTSCVTSKTIQMGDKRKSSQYGLVYPAQKKWIEKTKENTY